MSSNGININLTSTSSWLPLFRGDAHWASDWAPPEERVSISNWLGRVIFHLNGSQALWQEPPVYSKCVNVSFFLVSQGSDGVLQGGGGALCAQDKSHVTGCQVTSHQEAEKANPQPHITLHTYRTRTGIIFQRHINLYIHLGANKTSISVRTSASSHVTQSCSSVYHHNWSHGAAFVPQLIPYIMFLHMGITEVV